MTPFLPQFIAAFMTLFLMVTVVTIVTYSVRNRTIPRPGFRSQRASLRRRVTNFVAPVTRWLPRSPSSMRSRAHQPESDQLEIIVQRGSESDEAISRQPSAGSGLPNAEREIVGESSARSTGTRSTVTRRKATTSQPTSAKNVSSTLTTKTLRRAERKPLSEQSSDTGKTVIITPSDRSDVCPKLDLSGFSSQPSVVTSDAGLSTTSVNSLRLEIADALKKLRERTQPALRSSGFVDLCQKCISGGIFPSSIGNLITSLDKGDKPLAEMRHLSRYIDNELNQPTLPTQVVEVFDRAYRLLNKHLAKSDCKLTFQQRLLIINYALGLLETDAKSNALTQRDLVKTLRDVGALTDLDRRVVLPGTRYPLDKVVWKEKFCERDGVTYVVWCETLHGDDHQVSVVKFGYTQVTPERRIGGFGKGDYDFKVMLTIECYDTTISYALEQVMLNELTYFLTYSTLESGATETVSEVIKTDPQLAQAVEDHMVAVAKYLVNMAEGSSLSFEAIQNIEGHYLSDIDSRGHLKPKVATDEKRLADIRDRMKSIYQQQGGDTQIIYNNDSSVQAQIESAVAVYATVTDDASLLSFADVPPGTADVPPGTADVPPGTADVPPGTDSLAKPKPAGVIRRYIPPSPWQRQAVSYEDYFQQAHHARAAEILAKRAKQKSSHNQRTISGRLRTAKERWLDAHESRFLTHFKKRYGYLPDTTSDDDEVYPNFSSPSPRRILDPYTSVPAGKKYVLGPALPFVEVAFIFTGSLSHPEQVRQLYESTQPRNLTIDANKLPWVEIKLKQVEANLALPVSSSISTTVRSYNPPLLVAANVKANNNPMTPEPTATNPSGWSIAAIHDTPAGTSSDPALNDESHVRFGGHGPGYSQPLNAHPVQLTRHIRSNFPGGGSPDNEPTDAISTWVPHPPSGPVSWHVTTPRIPKFQTTVRRCNQDADSTNPTPPTNDSANPVPTTEFGTLVEQVTERSLLTLLFIVVARVVSQHFRTVVDTGKPNKLTLFIVGSGLAVIYSHPVTTAVLTLQVIMVKIALTVLERPLNQILILVSVWPGTVDAEPGTVDAEPGTVDAEPGTVDAEPGTVGSNWVSLLGQICRDPMEISGRI